MRTTVCLLASVLVACADEPLVDVEAPTDDRAGPDICEVLADDGGDVLDKGSRAEGPFAELLRLPGPRQPRGGLPQPTTPPAPNDPRDYCELTNRCTMRAAGSGREWHGAVQGSKLVIGYTDDSGTVHSTIVDALPPGTTAFMATDEESAVALIDDGIALRGYRICVPR